MSERNRIKELELQVFTTGDQNIQEVYVLYKRRYLMAALFALSTICSSMMFSTCNPIAAELTEIYGISPSVVSLAANGFFLMHPIFTFPQTYIANRYSIGLSLKIGCSFTLLGAMIRSFTFFTDRFTTIIIGQLIAGIGRPFIINIQANVAREWFLPEDKTSVMIAFSFLITCSNILGVLIPGLMFKGYTPELFYGKQLTSKLMINELILFTILLVPSIMLFQSKPPTPPGLMTKTDNLQNYSDILKKIFKNKNFLLLFFCYSLIMGGFHAMAVVISFLFSPFGFHPTQTSAIQSAPIICGFFSSIAYSYCIKKYKPNLKHLVLVSLIPVVIIFGLAYSVISLENFIVLLITFAILGIFVIPVIPLQLEISCRVIYPINQSMAVGFLLAGVHLWSFIFGETLSYVTSQQSQTQSFYGCMLLFFSFLVAFICFIFVTIPKSQKEETDNKIQQQNTIDIPEGPI